MPVGISRKRKLLMERIGLVDDIVISAIDIDQGRKWLDTDGMEHEGRVTYRRGLVSAIDSFHLARSLADENLELLIRAEYVFIEQELLFCDPTDIQAVASLNQAVQDFDDALLSLEAVEGDSYRVAEMTHPHSSRHRVKGMPKDSLQYFTPPVIFS